MSSYRSSVDLGLPVLPIVTTPELATEFLRVYNALRSLASALDAYTGALSPETEYWAQLKSGRNLLGNLGKLYYPTYEALVVGSLVGFYNDAGTVKCRKSDGTYLCRGFVTAVYAAGDVAEITVLGMMPQFSVGTLTPGATYYQGATAGTLSASGSRAIGFAVDDQNLFFHPMP